MPVLDNIIRRGFFQKKLIFTGFTLTPVPSPRLGRGVQGRGPGVKEGFIAHE